MASTTIPGPSKIRSAARFVRYRMGSVDQRYGFEKNLFLTKLRLFGSRDPILVYTMGKVGSSTLTKSLNLSCGPKNIIQVHWLTAETLAADEALYRKVVRQYAGTPAERGLFPYYIWRGQHVRRNILDRPDRGAPVRAIALSRDPVARNVSAMFQNLISRFDYDFNTELALQGAERVKEDMRAIFLENYVAESPRIDLDCSPFTWFDVELKTNLGIDVFATPFDREAGYQIYHSPEVEVLVFRTEDLNRCAEPAVREFLKLDDFKLAPANVGSDKVYGEVYKPFVKSLKLPAEYLDRCYRSKMATHFYTDAELKAFRQRWE